MACFSRREWRDGVPGAAQRPWFVALRCCVALSSSLVLPEWAQVAVLRKSGPGAQGQLDLDES